MNYREKMREYLKEPEDGSQIGYGKWCMLTYEQREMITRLLDEMDGADEYIKKLSFENDNLKTELENLKNNTVAPALELFSVMSTLNDNKELEKRISQLEENRDKTIDLLESQYITGIVDSDITTKETIYQPVTTKDKLAINILKGERK